MTEKIEKDLIEDTTPKPKKKGLMNLTLEELEMLKIQLRDIFVIKGGASLNLSWTQIIRVVNYNADKEVLRWDHTFEEAVQVIEIFLM